PVLLALAFLSSLVLLDRPVGQIAFAGQLLFYGAALAGLARRGRSRDSRLFTVPYAFCLLQWTTLRAAFAFASGRATVRWKRPANLSEAS
ncbi:MAG TPA: hypothetical protein VMV18_14265, partial [bacterium]|nr:hypothetical protein [bacterium]